MIYSKAIKCRDCCSIMHESCASTRWCQKMIKDKNLEPAFNCHNNKDWRFISSPSSNSLVNHKHHSANLNTKECKQKVNLLANLKYSIYSSYFAINGFLKMANLLSSRRRSKQLINKANLEDKHVNLKFGLIEDQKMTRKKLKQIFKSELKKSPAKSGFNQPTITAYPSYLYTLSTDQKPLHVTNKVISDNDNCQAENRPDEPQVVNCDLFQSVQTFCLEDKKKINERLCATWPPQNVSNLSPIIIEQLPPKEQYEKHLNQLRLQNAHDFNVQEVIKEWSIPYKDLQFKEVLREGQFGYIHRGHWHGEVLIYTFRNGDSEESVINFWDKIVQLCMIRHENISLFMGACIESPNLAVITSARKGPSLYESIHIKRQSIYLPNKISIARQIAQAMGYLHAKGITHKRLTSNNVFLESRVKVCLMDQGSLTHGYNRTKYGVNSRGHLTYLSPELIRSVQVCPPYLLNNGSSTKQSDVYAFGSLLFELMVNKFPFENVSSHVIIWIVGSGLTENVQLIKGSPEMRSIVEACWSSLPFNRPPFSQIVKRLQENVLLSKKHSSSEPERLNKLGFI